MKYLIARHVIAFLGAVFFAWHFVPFMIQAAKKLHLLDVPDGRIKNHKAPVPYLGGLAIYIAFIAVLSVAYPFENRILWFILGTTFLLFIGLVDDLKVLTPLQKFIGQIFAVICFLKGGFSLRTNFFSDWINIAASGFWMLSVINAFNLVDVMDGLACTLAACSVFSFFIIALVLRDYLLSLLLVTMLGALGAFFMYNKPSARIYLGDAGSLFIGGFVAAIPLLIPWTGELRAAGVLPPFVPGMPIFEIAVSALVPIAIVGLPLLEVTSLIIIRRWKGIPFYNGSPDHYCLYLKRRGWSVEKILLFSAGASLLASICAICFMFGYVPLWFFLGGMVIFLGAWIKIIFWG